MNSFHRKQKLLVEEPYLQIHDFGDGSRTVDVRPTVVLRLCHVCRAFAHLCLTYIFVLFFFFLHSCVWRIDRVFQLDEVLINYEIICYSFHCHFDLPTIWKIPLKMASFNIDIRRPRALLPCIVVLTVIYHISKVHNGE